MMHACVGLSALSLLAATAQAQLPTLYASRPGQIVRLADLNGDGDYLDFDEVLTYATGLSGSLGACAARGNGLLVVSNSAGLGSIYQVQDLNGDGDALDFGEVTLFAQVPGTTLVGLACLDDACYSVDSITGSLYRFEDLNQDGDALDFAETTIVGNGLSGAVSIAAMPGGPLLVAMSSSAVPVRILQDRNGDGDFFDFAENITYAENFAAGADLACLSATISFLTRASDGKVLRLQDLTGDGDSLDFGEVVEYAVGIGSASKVAIAGDDVFVAAADTQGNLWRLHDSNLDGDALDFGEVRFVAQGLTQVGGLTAVIVTSTCLAGDADGDGAVSMADVPGFVNGLLGVGGTVDSCRLDTNQDGLVDGRDVGGLVRRLVP